MLASLETAPFRAVGICADPSPYSTHSRTLLMRGLSELSSMSGQVELVELSRLPADELLGRNRGSALEKVMKKVAECQLLAFAAPRSITGFGSMLRVFLDRFPVGSLAGKIGVAFTTGGDPSDGIRSRNDIEDMLSRLGLLLACSPVHGADEDFAQESPVPALIRRVDRAVALGAKFTALLGTSAEVMAV